MNEDVYGYVGSSHAHVDEDEDEDEDEDGYVNEDVLVDVFVVVRVLDKTSS